jgi:hypothetical protein
MGCNCRHNKWHIIGYIVLSVGVVVALIGTQIRLSDHEHILNALKKTTVVECTLREGFQRRLQIVKDLRARSDDQIALDFFDSEIREYQGYVDASDILNCPVNNP